MLQCNLKNVPVCEQKYVIAVHALFGVAKKTI